MRAAAITTAALLAIACRPGARPPDRDAHAVQAVSLLGDSLRAPVLSDSARVRLEADLAAARAAWERDTAAVDAIVWLGRRTAYLGRYREAIAIYTAGLTLDPDEPHLLRHRGHRLLTLRRADAAIADLARAAAVTADRPDEVEPDGIPNARNEPRSTLQTNIWYHLALGRYLEGDFAAAARAWERCATLAANDDMLVAAIYWRYLALRRDGRGAEAAAVLEGVRPGMDVVENHAYYRLLRLFAGALPPDSAPTGALGSLDDVTTAYGLAAWRLVEGDSAGARALMERIVRTPQWPAFGYLAAEADLARRRAGKASSDVAAPVR